MIETAENLARDYGITREAADAFAVRSHQRAAAAWAARHASPTRWCRSRVPQQQGRAAGRSIATKASAPTPASRASPSCKPLMKDGTVTAGNACQQNDAAAACLVVAEDKLAELGLEPIGWLVGWAAAGCEPSHMGIGPVPAVRQAVRAHRACASTDMDLVELNEAFACQVLAVLKGWGWDDPETTERQRLGHLARPPDRRHRRAHHDHAAARAAAPRRRATGWRRCASAAAKASPRSSNAPDRCPATLLNRSTGAIVLRPSKRCRRGNLPMGCLRARDLNAEDQVALASLANRKALGQASIEQRLHRQSCRAAPWRVDT